MAVVCSGYKIGMYKNSFQIFSHIATYSIRSEVFGQIENCATSGS